MVYCNGIFSHLGAEAIAQGLVYGAQKTSEYISAGANYVVDRMQPTQTDAVIKPEVKKGVKTDRKSVV